MGTSELYSVVEEIEEVVDSLVVHLESADELILFVVLRPRLELDDRLRKRISDALGTALSPRHRPDTVVAVPAIPRTLTGKKLELPVKKILTGTSVRDVVSRDALSDPDSIQPFAEYAESRPRPELV
jgi:acetoacetyl-CoA synthetase